jgi:hypothetical protein
MGLTPPEGDAVPLEPTGETRVTPARTEASSAPVRKVIAATGGAAFGVATADLVIGTLADLLNSGQPLPEYLVVWLSLAIPALVAALAGYYTKRAPGE